jgi:hypothetical protein
MYTKIVGGYCLNKVYLREIEWSGMDWIHLAQDRDQWRALVNTIMKLRVREKLVNSRAAERVAASERHSAMELVTLVTARELD